MTSRGNPTKRAKRIPRGRNTVDQRACAIFEVATKALKRLPPGYSVYVASSTMCLMRGPSHDEDARPLRDNIVVTDGLVRISGGDW